MSLFRDQDGNLYEIPEGDLQRFRVEGEVPEGSELTGAELPEEAAPAAARAPGEPSYLYCYWYEGDRPGDRRTSLAPDAGRPVPGPAYLYCYWYEGDRPGDRRTVAPALARPEGGPAYLYCYWYEGDQPPKQR
jgi:hypothetical protein